MQKTVLNDIHRELGAKMVPFAGFDMPVEYSGINKEHMAVREAAGIFDVSHMGEFWVKGPNAQKLIQYVTSNDVAALPFGKAQYSCLPNKQGGIVDDLIVYHYEAEKYMLVVNASNMEKDWKWINENNSFGAELENASDKISLIAVQGPKAASILQKITTTDLSSVPYYSFKVGTIGKVDNVIISNTGYTGSGGFELYVYNEEAPALWNAVMEAGTEFGLLPAGLGARDTLRLEAGLALYGNDLDDTTSPVEAGLGWITKLVDGNDFISRKLFEQQKEKGVVKRLKGFVLQERGIPRHGYEIVDADGNNIGTVTSGTMSPMLKQGIGMGYLKKGFWKPESEIFIRVRNKDLRAKVVKPPFVEL
ncbi:aminomethyltransferase [Marinilabilia salmonicolor]|jgi:aminomethyltransferase|uniref:glycine cleavage system aminomethyltransferase GcvT n=1 Tax=Marinilabilia salmonicolor TaxID=989 RepID=UPI000D05CFD9|nr:glycine cleavage system aminomethyltransferase GcvT [Marinilabilia salmonicolor]PRY95992.1 aminomethyltransferase [Marinilabilia salmonicolor]